jgi:Flp pilus assembly protein TadD
MWDFLGRHRPWLGRIFAAYLGTWALVSFATYWISADAAQTQLLLGIESGEQRHAEQAITHFNAALRVEPKNFLARSQLASVLDGAGRSTEARVQIERNLVEHPDSAMCQLQGAFIASSAVESLARIRRALAFAPDCLPAHAMLVQLLQQSPQRDELIAAGRESLRANPADGATHFALGLALISRVGDEEEGREHLRLAGRLSPNSSSILGTAAWILATHPNEPARDGALAVQFAEKVCQLTNYKSAVPLLTLAAAQAEAGRFETAANTAVQAEKVAADSGETQLIEQCRGFATLFRAGRPFHQSPPR